MTRQRLHAVRSASGRRRYRQECGLTLVELMVTMAIGVFLIAGALTVFAKTRDLYRTNEDAARLQETARFAMSILETDLRMANHWGLTNRADLIVNGVNGPDDDLPAAIDTALEAEIDRCGGNWPLRVFDFVEAFDGSAYPFPAACGATGTWRPGSDVLVVRRASVNVVPTLVGTAGQLKVQSTRTGAALFSSDDPTSTGFLAPVSQTRLLISNAYYVSTNDATGVPMLRRKRLDFDAGATVIVDEELTPGVEDLQVEFGIDDNGDQLVDYYTTPPAMGLAASEEAIAVRVRLRLRSERPDFSLPGDSFRRMVVSKTVQLRNTRR